MSNKYILPYSSSLIEFLTLSEAEQHAISIGVDISLITISVYNTGSISADTIFNNAINAGYNIPSSPYYLGLEDPDRAQFSGMLSLLNEALEAGYVTTASSVTIRDKEYNIIPLTVGSFKGLMIGYGFYYKTLWDNRED